MYNKTFVDILVAGICDYTYIKTEIDSLISKIDLSSYYIKAEIDSLFSNINLSTYYTTSEVDGIDNGLFALVLNTYTKTEIDTQLADYATISYLQGNYVTALSITGTLMSNYASITLLIGNSYDQVYLDNQFSLKADVSQLAEFVTTDYLSSKCIDSV